MATDDNYKEASQMIEETARKQVVAKTEINRDLSQQRSALRLRLAERKLKSIRSNSFFEENESVLKKMPMSTRSNSFMPKFGGITRESMMEGAAYAPNRQDNIFQSVPNKQTVQNNSMFQDRRSSVSTRANDPMQIMFANPSDEEENEVKGVNVMDISGIAENVDISNMEDSSFVLHLDSFNPKLGSKTRQFNTCKCE